jgi:hypothetical protein
LSSTKQKCLIFRSFLYIWFQINFDKIFSKSAFQYNLHENSDRTPLLLPIISWMFWFDCFFSWYCLHFGSRWHSSFNCDFIKDFKKRTLDWIC